MLEGDRIPHNIMTRCRLDPGSIGLCNCPRLARRSHNIKNTKGNLDSAWRSCTIDRAETKSETVLTKPLGDENAVRVFQCLYLEASSHSSEASIHYQPYH